MQGIALLINPIPTGLFAASATETLSKTVAGIPIMFLVCVAIAIAAEFTLRRGRLGLALRAVGSNEAAAHRMGVNVGLTRISAYCIAGSFAALAAMMLAVQIGTGDATAGQSYTLQSISAVVLGGASIYGGRGSFLGADPRRPAADRDDQRDHLPRTRRSLAVLVPRRGHPDRRGDLRPGQPHPPRGGGRGRDRLHYIRRSIVPMAKRLVIEGASIVTLDPKLGDIREGDVLIEDDAIVAVGPNLGVTDAEVIDGRGQIAIPGFANTHLHTWQHALRGVCADWTVKDYVRCWRIHLGPMYRPEDMYVGNYAGGLDALNAGVTLVVDYCHNVVTRDHAREALRGLRDAGVRALFGLAYTPVLDHGFAAAPSFEVENPDLPDHDSRVAFARQLAGEEFASKDGLVTLAIVPQEIEIARTWEEVVEEFHSARELDAWISLHANQSLTGHRWEDVRKLGKADLLGPDILFVHCSFSAEDELKMIADAGASVSVAAETEMQMGMGFPITGKLIELGVAPSLGVDITSNGSGDMFAQMRLALQVGRMLGDQEYYERRRCPRTSR